MPKGSNWRSVKGSTTFAGAAVSKIGNLKAHWKICKHSLGFWHALNISKFCHLVSTLLFQTCFKSTEVGPIPASSPWPGQTDQNGSYAKSAEQSSTNSLGKNRGPQLFLVWVFVLKMCNPKLESLLGNSADVLLKSEISLWKYCFGFLFTWHPFQSLAALCLDDKRQRWSEQQPFSGDGLNPIGKCSRKWWGWWGWGPAPRPKIQCRTKIL